MRSPHQDIWLAHYVFVMTTVATGYPRAIPDAVTRKAHYTFFTGLARLMPKSKASEAYARALSLYPIQPHLDSRRNLLRWLHTVIDHVHAALYDSAPTPMSEFARAYRESCRPRAERERDGRRLLRRGVFGAAVVAITALILRAR